MTTTRSSSSPSPPPAEPARTPAPRPLPRCRCRRRPLARRLCCCHIGRRCRLLLRPAAGDWLARVPLAVLGLVHLALCALLPRLVDVLLHLAVVHLLNPL